MLLLVMMKMGFSMGGEIESPPPPIVVNLMESTVRKGGIKLTELLDRDDEEVFEIIQLYLFCRN